jgi:23S rRNA pseudouridine2605 synthase
MSPRPPGSDDGSLRLNRYLALAGLGSRRSVEALVRDGRVAVDGEIVRDLGRRIDPRRQAVTVDGQPAVLPADRRVYAFHKPVDVVSTLRPQGSQQGLEEFRRRVELPDRFKPVGRLDRDSTGLLLWTDDGDLAEALLRPRRGVWKTYEVTLAQALARGMERTLADGSLVLDGRPVQPCRLHGDPSGDRRRWRMELHEGRKRQVRRMFAAVGGRVVELVRVAVGPVQIGRLRPGHFRRLSREEERALRQAAGLDAPPTDRETGGDITRKGRSHGSS